MTFESAGSEDNISPPNEAASTIRERLSDDSIEKDHESSPEDGAFCNGSSPKHPSNTSNSNSSNLNNLRKTLAKWLRIQRPTTKSKKPRHR